MKTKSTCQWHSYGVPSRYQGEKHKWGWYVAGCPSCAAKWAGREVPADVMSPKKMAKLNLFGRIHKDRLPRETFEACVEKVQKVGRARLQHYAAMSSRSRD